MKKTIRIGTRGSPLALVQAEEIRKRLLAANPHLIEQAEVEIVPIRTTGDWKPEHQERRFIEMGGNKGLFTKEIEDALLSKHIDMAVHSMKDVASIMPPGLVIAAVLKREDPRDAFIGRTTRTMDELPAGSVIGTSSLRRQAQILVRRPDIRVIALRGNVETRLKKLADGVADATLLAYAGLGRLGLQTHASSVLDTTQMLPAAAQGALGIEMLDGNEFIGALLSPLNHAPSYTCVMAERAVMAAVDGSCHTPAGAFATIDHGTLTIEALVARADGSSMLRMTSSGPECDAEKIGAELGNRLRVNSPADLFTA